MPKGTLARLLLILCFALPLVSRAEVARIVFTTDPQTIAPGILSGALTIQTQDGSGNLFKTPETIDLEFLSTSPTGQFKSTTGGTLTKSMSTNTSNKNFAYQDASEGTYTITVNATGRTSGSHWTTSQTITITSSGGTMSSNDSQTSTSTPADNGSVTIGIPSSHYSFVPIAESLPQKFVVNAGRDRLGYTNMPLVFKALPNTDDPNADYVWSFGDGTTDRGRDLSHTYAFPGTYNVVLNAKLFEYQSVARVAVTVTDPNVSIINADSSSIEIKNNSKYEVNLYGWKIVGPNKSFEFPKDTIISAGGSIEFPRFVTGVSGNLSNLSLVAVSASPAQKITLPIEREVSTVAASTSKSQQLAEIGGKLSELERETYLLAQKQSAVPPAPEDLSQPAAAILSIPTSTASSTPHNSWIVTLKHFFQMR